MSTTTNWKGAIMATGVIGEFLFGAFAAAPTDFLAAKGQAVSRTTYAALFAAIGTAYGEGDGATTFNLPDTRGRVLVAIDTAQTEFKSLGQKTGAKAVALTESQMPKHLHYTMAKETVWEATGYGLTKTGGFVDRVSVSTNNPDGSFKGAWGQPTDERGEGSAHSNIQPSLTVGVFIRYR